MEPTEFSSPAYLASPSAFDSKNILHLDSGRTWRGGQNQVKLLIEGMKNSIPGREPTLRPFLAAPVNCPLLIKTPQEVPKIHLYSLGMRGLRQLIAGIDQFDIHLVDAHSSKAHQLALFAKLFRPNIKVLVHRHVDIKPSRNLLWGYLKYRTQRIDGYVAVSNKVANTLKSIGISYHKIHTIPSTIDPAPYQNADKKIHQSELRKNFKIPHSAFLMGSACALTEEKGVSNLLLALHQLSQDQKDFVMLIAGDGPLRCELEQKTKDLDLEKHVIFVGFQENVESFILGLDLFVLSSLSEALGTVIQDAVHAKTPVVATRTGGIPEMITDGQGGLLCTPDQPHELSKAIETMIKNPSLRDACVSFSLKHIQAHFSLEKMIRANMAVYEKLLASEK